MAGTGLRSSVSVEPHRCETLSHKLWNRRADQLFCVSYLLQLSVPCYRELYREDLVPMVLAECTICTSACRSACDVVTEPLEGTFS